VAAIVATVALSGWWTAPPWPSRLLARRATARGLAWGLVVAGVFACALAAAACFFPDPVIADLAITAVALTVALVAGVFRQWRFRVGHRRADACFIAAASAAILGVVAPLSFVGSVWTVPAAGVVVIVALGRAWPLVATVDARSAQRIPERRSASE
jgi:hypothetical protein